jgi:hypothetical protein
MKLPAEKTVFYLLNYSFEMLEKYPSLILKAAQTF